MSSASIARSYLWLAIILAFFLSVEYWIVQSIGFNRNPDLISIGVTIDLTLGIPALFYLLLVRPRKYSLLLLFPVFLISLLIATVMIPSTNQEFLSYEKKIVPFFEILLIAYVFTKIRKVRQRYREIKAREYFFLDGIRQAVGDVFNDNKAVNILLTELLLMYLAIFGWFKKYDAHSVEAQAFTYHRKSSYSTILVVMIMLLCIETAALHIIVLHWSRIAAIILTGLSIYSLLWLVGDFHAIRIQPVLVTQENIELRIGIRWKSTIPISSVESVDAGSGPPRNAKNYVRASVLAARVVLNLNQPANMKGLFGMTRHPSKIGLSIDDVDGFRDEILKRKEAD
jgi:membrane protein YdbS with pleckstrin-like domain